MAAKYMLRRNDRYQFRIRVPRDLVPLFGIAEIHRTLRTSDRKLARSVAQTLRANAENLFATVHHQRLLGMSDEQVRETAHSLLMAQLFNDKSTGHPN